MKVDAVLYLVLTKRERQVGDLNAGKCFGCSDHEMVEFKALMGGRGQKAALSLNWRRTLCPFQKSWKNPVKDSLEDLGDFQESDLQSSRTIYPDVQEIKQNGPR